uniref:Uncharacterized protein n=1 Tax=Rhizophora mucronata TaxID=61149 RepID=A0A2P2PTH4_RHIMU
MQLTNPNGNSHQRTRWDFKNHLSIFLNLGSNLDTRCQSNYNPNAIATIYLLPRAENSRIPPCQPRCYNSRSLDVLCAKDNQGAVQPITNFFIS